MTDAASVEPAPAEPKLPLTPGEKTVWLLMKLNAVQQELYRLAERNHYVEAAAARLIRRLKHDGTIGTQDREARRLGLLLAEPVPGPAFVAKDRPHIRGRMLRKRAGRLELELGHKPQRRGLKAPPIPCSAPLPATAELRGA